MKERKFLIRFYAFWRWSGIAASIALYLIVVMLNDGRYVQTALWFFPLMIVIQFGCFAVRDEKYELGDNRKGSGKV